MARLASVAKGGYYPAPPAAIAHVMRYVAAPTKGKFSILDPCCGEGAALRQIREILNCPPAQTYAIELEDERINAARLALPNCNVVGPASYFGCGITYHSFQFCWCNPPFDADLEAGERVEMDFLQQTSNLLATGGILALVLPETTAERRDIESHLGAAYDRVSIVPFPESHRPFREVVVFGVRRKELAGWRSWEDEVCCEPNVNKPYRIPVGDGPLRFEKTSLTHRELITALDRSPLQRHLTVTDEPPLLSPPLPLGKGHIALLLASGHLDGIVRPPNEEPHVVRGTAKKIKYLVGVEERDDATVTTYAEKITLTVRVATSDGTIRTFDQDPELIKEPINAEPSKTTGNAEPDGESDDWSDVDDDGTGDSDVESELEGDGDLNNSAEAIA